MKSFHSSQENFLALVYARVSTVSQDSDSQVHRCKQYAEQKGYQIEEVFPDKYTGGGDFWNRPQMRRLLDYIDAHPDKNYVVIFDDLKRFARDTQFHIRLRNEFKNRGVKIECLNFNFEDSPEGEFVETMFAAQGQLERQQNRRQVIQKMKARLERGLWCFDFPPGMKYIDSPLYGKLLAPDEVKGEIVREALEGYASNKFPNQVDVQAFLESRGFFHRKQSRTVYLEQVKRILTQILYTGYVEYKPWDVSRRKGYHQGLISLETYEKIQEKLTGSAKRMARKDLHLDFPARGCILCSECKRPFTASWTTKSTGRKNGYYRCNAVGCSRKNKSIKKDDLEKGVGKFLKKVRARQEVLDLAEHIALDVWKARKADSSHFEDHLKKEVSKLNAEIEMYVKRIGKTTSETVVQAYEGKIEELSNRKLLLEEKLSKPVQQSTINFETAVAEVFGYIKNPYEIWTNGIFEDKRLVLRMVFQQCPTYNEKTGVETASLSLPVMLFQHSDASESRLVEMAGIEPASESGTTWCFYSV